MPNGANFVDLHVYVGGAAALGPARHPLRLRLRRPDAGLPAAVHLSAVRGRACSIRCTCCRSAWSRWLAARHHRRALRRGAGQPALLPAIVGGAAGASRCCGPRSASGSNRCAAPSTTARSTCCWCLPCCTPSTARDGGCRVCWSGLAAGVKLTPAVGGLYFVGARRWAAAVFSAVVFVATIVCRLLVRRRPGPLLLHRTARRRRAGSARSGRRSTSPGAAGSRASSATTPATARSCWSRIAVTAVLALLAWRARRRRRRPARPPSSSCSCSACCCRRSRGPITGCG